MKEKVKEYLDNIAKENGVSIDESTDLFAKGVLDSLGIIMLLTFLSEECGVEFDPEDLNYENYQTLAGINAWIDTL